MQRNLRHVARLMEAMDAIVEGNGQTMLDNSLVVVTSNMASSTVQNHAGPDAPVLLGGSLGGAFRMGEVIDYRDYDAEIARKATVAGDNSAGRDIYFGGPPTNELMISIMSEFGLGRSEWGHERARLWLLHAADELRRPLQRRHPDTDRLPHVP